MYGLNENNGLAAQCQTVFCQEHPGNWKGSGPTWPTGRVLGGSGLAMFHTEKTLKSGGLPKGLRPGVCVHAALQSTSALSMLLLLLPPPMNAWPGIKREIFLGFGFLSYGVYFQNKANQNK